MFWSGHPEKQSFPLCNEAFSVWVLSPPMCFSCKGAYPLSISRARTECWDVFNDNGQLHKPIMWSSSMHSNSIRPHITQNVNFWPLDIWTLTRMLSRKLPANDIWCLIQKQYSKHNAVVHTSSSHHPLMFTKSFETTGEKRKCLNVQKTYVMPFVLVFIWMVKSDNENRRTSNYWIAWSKKTRVYRGTRGCGPSENLKERLSSCR